ncbi:MAG TPA: hypothetical protein ENJ28_04320 [Gammaproteobacteria bacterium]|nr:hypothetical protein [Gammaproteobacteria bacterium]
MKIAVKSKMSLPDILILLMAISVLYYGLYGLQDKLLLIFYSLWDKVGVVIVGLLPLTFLLATIPVYWLLNQDKNNTHIILLLQIISFAAPSLGLLGTVLGTMEGTSAFSMAKGVEQLLNSVVELQRGLSVALLSTAWGTLLSIPSGIMLILLKSGNKPTKKSAYEINNTTTSENTTSSIEPEANTQTVELKTPKNRDLEVFMPAGKSNTNPNTVKDNSPEITPDDVINTLSSLGIQGVKPIKSNN